MPNFYSQIDTDSPLTDFQASLIDLCDNMLDNVNVDEHSRNILARLRAYVDINLKTLN